ncbi:hypothetical protein [Acinetobacter sp. ANC 4973]|uniref:hypothetical protein n=1 Tax=Acinetobacter sp. ANC 4973 TaxID=1977871 RepID=UPI000A3568DE|nr:hypothetical protein [Acinetobacter sp. ANC 4973]OTG99817.1 hypothetical protein B9T30_06720 [Acinetobacter sp. ANC 4973]
MPKMTKEQRDDFLRIECVIMVARYLDIISDQYLPLDQFDLLKDRVVEKSPEVAEKLENFQNIYKEWFQTIVESESFSITTKEVDVILKKDKARETLSQVCVQYRKDNNLPEI